MALLDPADQDKIHHSGDHTPTTKPMLCLAGGFAFLVATALVFHYAFTALL
ncbi:hypothetical protein BH09PSE1_BH09PSE1_27490 [soil metagenome]